MNTKILEEVNKLIKEDSLTRTNIKGVNLYKTTTYLPRTPLTYDFCLYYKAKKLVTFQIIDLNMTQKTI